MSWIWMVLWLWMPELEEESVHHCRVRIEGLPRVQLRYHQLVVGRRSYRAEPEVVVEVGPSEPPGRLRGPRYQGEVALSVEACNAEPVLTAEPLPADVTFSCLPKTAVVSCVDCPGWVRERVYLPDDVPDVAMAEWSRDVTLWFQARGFEPQRLEVTVHPGPNRIEVEMVPRRREESTMGTGLAAQRRE